VQEELVEPGETAPLLGAEQVTQNPEVQGRRDEEQWRVGSNTAMDVIKLFELYLTLGRRGPVL
jgi:hypothetical protein